MTIYNDDFLTDMSSAEGLKDDILYFQWLYTRLANSNTKLWIVGLPAYEAEWNNFIVEKYKQLPVKPDKIILNTMPEPFTAESWNCVIDALLGIGYTRSQLLAIYGSFVRPNIDITCLADHRYLNRYKPYEVIDYTDIFSRTHKFVALSGMPRPNRVMFTKELLMRNLKDHGIITCGSLGDSFIKDRAVGLYDFLDLGEYRSQFPVIYDSEFPSYNAEKLHFPFLDAVYNVVEESGFEDYLNLRKHPEFSFFMLAGSEPFMSEKTTKAFGFYQIPVFVAAKGYVNEMRKLGFDVFDDIVNHDYDNITDPHQRMVVIADEVQRLVNTDLPDNNLKLRLVNNYNLIKDLYFKQKQKNSLEILKWFNQ